MKAKGDDTFGIFTRDSGGRISFRNDAQHIEILEDNVLVSGHSVEVGEKIKLCHGTVIETTNGQDIAKAFRVL